METETLFDDIKVVAERAADEGNFLAAGVLNTLMGALVSDEITQADLSLTLREFCERHLNRGNFL